MAEQLFFVDINLNKNKVKSMVIESLATAPTSPVDGQVYRNSVDGNVYMWSVDKWVNLSQVINNPASIKGEITNANSNPGFPSGASQGDIWFITTNAGTVGGQTVEIGDMLINGASGWFIVQRNVTDASETIKGLIEIATQAETNAATDDVRAVTPLKLAGFLSNYLYSRKVITTIATLAANTATDVTHGLNLSDQDGLHVQAWQGNQLIGLAVNSVTANKVTVTSNNALSNVKVVCVG